MKKITLLFALLLSWCLCVNSNAQIQTSFWGLELSKSYTLYEAKGIISNRCDDISVRFSENELLAFDGRFGGYVWDYASFSFYGGGDDNKLSKVLFFSSFSDYDSAEIRYKALLRKLEEKYGSSIMLSSLSHWWSDSDWKYKCNLCMMLSSDETEILVALAYFDTDLWDASNQEEDDEL